MRAGFSVFVLHGCRASDFVLHRGGVCVKQMRIFLHDGGYHVKKTGIFLHATANLAAN